MSVFNLSAQGEVVDVAKKKKKGKINRLWPTELPITIHIHVRVHGEEEPYMYMCDRRVYVFCLCMRFEEELLST